MKNYLLFIFDVMLCISLWILPFILMCILFLLYDSIWFVFPLCSYIIGIPLSIILLKFAIKEYKLL